jgi:MFS family permease
VNGLAQNPSTLIVGRAVQGLGGALVSPAVLSIIIVTFESVGDRAKALGSFSAVTASGSAAGILAGGVLTEWLDWRAVFLVNVPIAVLAIVGALRVVPNRRHRIEGRRNWVDLPGAITITAGLLLLVYGIVNASDRGWGSGKTLAVVAAAVVLIALFLVIELASRQPLVRRSRATARSRTAWRSCPGRSRCSWPGRSPRRSSRGGGRSSRSGSGCSSRRPAWSR